MWYKLIYFYFSILLYVSISWIEAGLFFIYKLQKIYTDMYTAM